MVQGILEQKHLLNNKKIQIQIKIKNRKLKMQVEAGEQTGGNNLALALL